MSILIPKTHEIDFILKKSKEHLEKSYKPEYLILSYLNDEEYRDIYNENFKGKVSKIFKKIVEVHGKNYLLAKSKVSFINHIKSMYKFIKEN